MTDKKIINMANYCSNALLWSPKDMLIDAIQDVEHDYSHINKAMIIFYDEDNHDNRKRIRWSQSGMRRSEILNLLSLAYNDLMLTMYDELAE